MSIEDKIQSIGIVPVVVLDHSKDAGFLADALCEGGIFCAEVTFRTEAAEESIGLMTARHPDMLVGAGTVLNTEQVDRAVSAGAKFIVSPGFDEEIVDYCIERNISVFPGCITPSELAKAVKRKLRLVKFFPAEQFGGIDTIKALAAPYGNIRFMPTGGINTGNLSRYLSCDKIAACGGSWMVKKDLIKAGEFEKIKIMAEKAVQLVADIRKQEGRA